MGFIKTFTKKFRDTSIIFKLSSIIFLVLFIFSVHSYVNFTAFTREIKNSTNNTVHQINTQAVSKIDDYLADIVNISKIPLTFKQNDSTYLKALKNYNDTNIASIQFQKMNEQMFEEILTYKKNIESCFVFNLNGSGDYKVKTPIIKAMNPLEASWFQQSTERFGKPVIIDTYPMPYLANNKEPIYVFGVSRGIVDLQSSKVIGILLVNTQIDYFKAICEHMKLTEGTRILILHDNYTIYDTQEENITQLVSSELTTINWSNTEDSQTLSINDVNYFASSVLSEYSGWRIISLIPTDELYKESKAMQRSTLLLDGLLMSVTIFVFFMVMTQILSPLKKLVALMKLAETGDFNARIEIKSQDEIGVLSKSFNSMIAKINSLIQEVYLEQIKKSDLELLMLQEQINPHFLYNTLESISMMATINDDDTAAEMASNLGTILRYGISKSNAEVSLKEELDCLDKYIALQAIRFSSLYTIDIQIDPNLYSIPMIKLILQPIVENAIYHGMKSIRGGGKIVVTAYKKEKSALCFEVKDNGAGMSLEQVANLNGYLNDENQLYKSIGLKNVHRRIQIRYGKDFGLRIYSTPGVGTTVTATICIESGTIDTK